MAQIPSQRPQEDPKFEREKEGGVSRFGRRFRARRKEKGSGPAHTFDAELQVRILN